MQFAPLGRSRLEVSRLCLGTMNFAKFANEAASHAMLDAATDAGINYVDTANSYGVEGRRGAVEEIIGSWFAGDPGRRDRVVLATKLFEAQGDGPNAGGLSALAIRKAAEDSLRRLRTDRIDILQMHHIDRLAPWSEIWEAFSVLRDQGKILYVGSSNFAGWQLTQGQYEARLAGSFGIVSEQSVYSLAQRTIELEVLPAARALGVGVVAWSPLAGGLLAAAQDGGRRASDPAFAERARRHEAALEATAAIAAELGVSVARLAIGWLLAQPGLVSAIVGPRTTQHLDDLIGSADLHLDADALARLDAAWPGPGGPAPEAYAW
jgi:NDP-hexose C3-ketoreductase / dTDP-4-oxo-2-deoxy-alpha-D-pentos-2-ene 2,3-reductase